MIQPKQLLDALAALNDVRNIFGRTLGFLISTETISDDATSLVNRGRDIAIGLKDMYEELDSLIGPEPSEEGIKSI